LKFKELYRGVISFFALLGVAATGLIVYLLLFNPFNAGSVVKVVWLIKNEALKHESLAAITQGAMRGMADSLHDPYSVYLSKSEFQDLDVRLQGSFSGIGIYVAAGKDNQITVIAPIKESPAARAGIKSGDILTKIDGETTKSMSVEEAVNRIRGENGTQVEISVYRESDREEHDFKVIRDTINIDSVDSRLVKGDPKLGYVQIIQFTSKTPEEFEDHVNALLKQGVRGLVIDLRDDPGGDFESAVRVADTILDKGTIVKIADRKGTSEVISSTPGGLEMPIVLLVNKGSASSSEILAGALKDNNAALLVGEKTYGKGIVQTVFSLPGGGALKLTTDQYFTPKGTDINQIGILPDYTVANTDKKTEDAQFDKALAILREKLGVQ
jgi:carboxyl-terminal processing protease